MLISPGIDTAHVLSVAKKSRDLTDHLIAAGQRIFDVQLNIRQLWKLAESHGAAVNVTKDF